MAAVWYRFRAELRTRWRAWLGLALVVGLAGGAVLMLAAGARRTDSAYPRFLRAQQAFDLLVINNPGQIGGQGGGTAILELEDVRRLPEVADAAPVGTFFITLGAGIGALVPPDDHIGTELNEFEMLEGRRVRPDRPDEVVVSFTLADQYGLGIGDELDIVSPGFLRAYEFFRENPEELTEEDAGYLAALERVLELLPDGKATIVGIQASPGEFPPQIEGSGRYLVHTSPALYPVRAELAGLSEGGDSLLIRLANGASDTDVFLDHIEELGGGEVPDIVVAAELNRNAQRSFHTQATALWLLALLTAITALLVVGQLLARFTAVQSTDNPTLSSLGATVPQRAALSLCRAAVIGIVGGLLAVALAFVVSPVFPTGLARTAEPDPGLSLDTPVALLGVLGILVVVVVLTLWPAWRSARTVRAAERPRSDVSFSSRLLARAATCPWRSGRGSAWRSSPARDPRRCRCGRAWPASPSASPRWSPRSPSVRASRTCSPAPSCTATPGTSSSPRTTRRSTRTAFPCWSATTGSSGSPAATSGSRTRSTASRSTGSRWTPSTARWRR